MKKKIIIIGVVVIILIAGGSYALIKLGGANTVNAEEAKIIAENYINANLMPAGQKATVKGVIEEGDLYKITVDVGSGQDIASYLTKDGSKFFPQVMEIKDDESEVDLPDDQNTNANLDEILSIKDNDNVRGNKDAAVTIVEYSDFECPFCFRHNSTMDELYEAYKDKALFVFRHFPLSFHAEAQKAAEASECAAEQGKFWEMHDQIFAANENETMSVEQWKTETKNLALDVEKFNECLDSGKYASKVQEQMNSGKSAGVSGVPATFVNSEVFSGALPYEDFQAAIEKNLNK